VRPGAVVLDVGINTVPLRRDEVDHDGRPFRVVGDVAFDEVSGVAAAITPVPGGVGPMTIAALMQNTLLAAEHKAKKLKKLEDDARKWTDPVD
jgi:methylenetetrahydrofolate dehydrogenase (NADP+)/methenyltetrahydrofolate cyclohydrolase